MANDIKINKAVIVQEGLEVYPGVSRTATPIHGGGDAEGVEKFISLHENITSALSDGEISPISLSVGSYSLVSKTVTHTTTAAGTNTVPVQVPVGARIVGASVEVTTDLVFTGDSDAASLAWDTSSESVAASLQTSGDTASAMFDSNSASPVVASSAEDMVLDANNTGGLGAGGVIKVTVWYEQITA